LRKQMTQAVARDATGFTAVMTAMKLPKDTPDQQALRLAAIERATLVAAEIPLETAQNAIRVMELANEVASSGNLNAISDAASGSALARAALTGASLNVRINVHSLQDPRQGQGFVDRVTQLESRAGSLEEQLRQTLSERSGLSLS
jgi:glutamate formiminotransferase / formiminotetrahydrofolate cyclodeaminase